MATSNPTAARGDVSALWRKREGEYLRGLRNAVGWTQAELAELVGFGGSQAISNIERGALHLPPTHIIPMAHALDQPLPVFGKRLLRWQNPWLFGAIFGIDKRLDAELKRAAVRGSNFHKARDAHDATH